MLASITRT